MPATYEPIATTTLTGMAYSISITSIPQTYTDLRCVLSARCDTTTYDCTIQMNIGTASGCSSVFIDTYGTSVIQNRLTNVSYLDVGSCPGGTSTSSSIFAVSIHDILNYTQTNLPKVILSKSANEYNVNGTGQVQRTMGVNYQLNAVSTVNFLSGTGGFIAGTTLTVYGIKAA